MGISVLNKQVIKYMKIKHWVICQILIMILMGVFLFGCIGFTPAPIATSTPIVLLSPWHMDKSPFTGIPCAAPCWHGLEVGKSTEKDTIAVLPDLTFIDQNSVQIYRRPSMPDFYTMLSGPGAQIVANCVNSNKRCVDLATSNDILQRIIVSLNYEIMADEAIGYLGNPDYVAVAPVGGEIFICDVYLIWSSSRLVLVSTFRADDDLDGVRKYCHVVRDTGKVPTSLLISEVRYLSEAELDALITGTGKFFEFTGTIPDK
jgi:hypothetical protein